MLFVYDGTTPADFEEATRVGDGPAALRRRRHAGRAHLDHRPRPAARGQAGPAGPQRSTATPPTSTAGRRRGSARPWPGPARWPATPTWPPASSTCSRTSSGSRACRPTTAREIRRMKARIERERIPPGEDPQFHLKLGRGSLSDVEWTAQLLQLRWGMRSPSTMGALELLDRAGPPRPPATPRCWPAPTASARRPGTACSWFAAAAGQLAAPARRPSCCGWPGRSARRPRAARGVPPRDAPGPPGGGAAVLRQVGARQSSRRWRRDPVNQPDTSDDEVSRDQPVTSTRRRDARSGRPAQGDGLGRDDVAGLGGVEVRGPRPGRAAGERGEEGRRSPTRQP